MARGPSLSISKSVAMLSLVAIIFSAAVRTETRAPTGSSRPEEPTALLLAVTVSRSSQDTVLCWTAPASACNTYNLKIDASGRDSPVLVPATGSQRPLSTFAT
ncbi:Uncharacterised protein [Mycobacterium tuberculosis]|nr:Uncharacterised protein [Mycobacterium tuberculosis]